MTVCRTDIRVEARTRTASLGPDGAASNMSGLTWRTSRHDPA
ncbi:MAG: hypothetical protein OXH79_02130 [Boseongicola sp.]|nr:hypothetical protein [Boseongicola sp.]